MSAATVDRYLAPARARMRLKGISTTKASPLLRNSIRIRTVGDERGDRPGAIEADTVAGCGPTFVGEFARTLTMTDMVTGWTENASIRNNASRWITEAVEALQASFPSPVVSFDSDNGSEFINHDVAAWLQARDIEQTRSRPYHKNDQATVESKSSHVVRKHAFYWRCDTAAELNLLNKLWPLVSLRLNFFTPGPQTHRLHHHQQRMPTTRLRQPQDPTCLTCFERLRSGGASHASSTCSRAGDRGPMVSIEDRA